MSHSRAVQWAQLFVLPEQPALPLQARLRLAIVHAILEGRLGSGAPLPSSRELALLLGMSRNTVTSAYLQLVDEGFLEARARSGVFVAPNARPLSAAQAEPLGAASRHPPDWRARVLRSLADRPTLSKPERWSGYPYPFIYGTYDPQLFPTEDFRECCVRSLARSQLPHWTPDLEIDDVPELIEQIRTRLLPRRGVFALKEEILVTVGTQNAYYLLAEALFDQQTRVGLEEPGHPHARNSFSMRRPQWVEIAVDEDGLVVDALAAVDYLFITPSHQSPTTATLSLERRQWLLRQAELQDFVIIEDDYEAENLYEGEPMPALKSMDRAGRVIYVGSVSKSLSPALRLGYIVAPALADRRTAPDPAHHGAPPQRVPAACLRAVPFAGPPRIPHAAREPGHAGAAGPGGAGAARASARVPVPGAPGRGIDLGAGTALGGRGRTRRDGARAWRVDRGRSCVLRQAALPLPVLSPAAVVDRREPDRRGHPRAGPGGQRPGTGKG